jgi:hypothetical protein
MALLSVLPGLLHPLPDVADTGEARQLHPLQALPEHLQAPRKGVILRQGGNTRS